MTSARSHDSRFLFRCPCGANFVTSKKILTWVHCGKTVELRRIRTRRRRKPEPIPLPPYTAARKF